MVLVRFSDCFSSCSGNKTPKWTLLFCVRVCFLLCWALFEPVYEITQPIKKSTAAKGSMSKARIFAGFLRMVSFVLIFFNKGL